MVRGDVVNASEQRPALHTALRSPADSDLAGPPAIRHAVHAELDRLRAFAERIRSGAWRVRVDRQSPTSSTSASAAATAARACCAMHWPSSPTDRACTSSAMSTVIVSRACCRGSIRPRRWRWSRARVSRRARRCSTRRPSARGWPRRASTTRRWRSTWWWCRRSPERPRSSACRRPTSFISGTGSAAAFVWSAIGLPALLALGPARFDEFLAGGHAMDRHALDSPLEANCRRRWRCWHSGTSRCCRHERVPAALRRSPARHGDLAAATRMESLGKSRGADGGWVACRRPSRCGAGSVPMRSTPFSGPAAGDVAHGDRPRAR